MAGIFQQDNPTPHAAGKNLFNIAKAKEIYKTSPFIKSTKNPNGYTITYDTGTTRCALILFEWGDINDFLGKTLTLSTKSTCTDGGNAISFIGISNDDGTVRQVLADIPEHPDANMTKVVLWLYSHCGSSTVTTNPSCTYYDIQVEEGTTATAYEPYQNLYIPQNTQ